MTEAVNAIYLLADRPDVLCADLIKCIAEEVIQPDRKDWSAAGMSKLLFLAGQIALQHSLHLDSIEAHWKRNYLASRLSTKAEDGKKTKSALNADGLEQVTASPEDDFAEVIKSVKESELLYGEKSLLKVFGPLAAFLALNNLAFPVLVLICCAQH